MLFRDRLLERIKNKIDSDLRYFFLKEKASEENVDAIELNLWGFNESAIKFYESLGMSVKNMKLEQLLSNEHIETKNTELKVTSKVNR